MFEAVGSVGIGGGGAVRAVSALVPAPAVKEQEAREVNTSHMSPRVKSDPYTGVIISEYLTSNGQKSIQIPSETVVAYLRSGLTAEGLPVKDKGVSVTAEA